MISAIVASVIARLFHWNLQKMGLYDIYIDLMMKVLILITVFFAAVVFLYIPARLYCLYRWGPEAMDRMIPPMLPAETTFANGHHLR